MSWNSDAHGFSGSLGGTASVQIYRHNHLPSSVSANAIQPLTLSRTIPDRPPLFRMLLNVRIPLFSQGFARRPGNPLCAILRKHLLNLGGKVSSAPDCRFRSADCDR